MANPTKPDLDYSYTGFEQSQGDASFPGTPLDNDLANLKTSIDETIDALAEVRRSDGALANEIVTYDSLDDSLKAKWQVGNAASEVVDPAKVFAGPPSGADAFPTFRALASTDLPLLNQGAGGAVPVSMYERAKAKPQFEDYGLLGKNIAALRAVVPAADGADILVQDYFAPGSGGGGVFRWSAASVAADNGGTVILPTGHSGAGRWLRIIDDDMPWNVMWFGAKGDNASDDRAAIQACIDAALPLGKMVRLPKGSYGVTSPIYLNGTNWATPVINGGLGKPVAGEQPFVRTFMGDAHANFGARIFALPGFTGEAVLFGRNTALRTVKNLHVDAAGIANVAIDISWVGSASGVPGTAAPACFNEISGLFGANALQMGIALDGQADSLVQNINYGGGSAPVGFSLQLPGGGIWANNIHIHQGRTLIAAQNARISDSVLLNGVRIVSSSPDLLEFTSCQFSTDADPDDPNNGYTIYSATNPGSFGTFAINFTSCFFLGADELAPVPHKAYFAGRWNTGCNFTACYFNKDNYFDAVNWTVNGSGGTAPPVFDFKHCVFAAPDGISPVAPATITDVVRVGLYSVLRGDGLMLARRDFPDDVRLLTSSATAGRLRLKDSFLWADASGIIRATKGTTPTADSSGNVLVQRQVGTASPVGSVTPTHVGAIFSDTTNAKVYVANNSTSANWIELTTVAGAYQPIDADLTAIAALTSAADRLPYATGAGAWSLATFTAAGRALVDDADNTAQRTTLGLGSIATQAASAVTITGGSVTGITDLAIADGGTGQSTAYAAKDALTIKGADMASASTVDLATATGDYVEITGTTTITAFGTMAAGVRKTLRFVSGLAITHNATSLIIPGNQNITVSAGNAIEVLSLGSGNWMVLGFSSFGANATFLVAGTVADARLPTTMAGKTLTGATVQVTATDAITAAGTTQGAATALTASLNNVTTVVAASADGVRLPATAVGASITVWNNDSSGSDTLKVYPASGSSIDALAADAADTITAGSKKTYRAITATKWLTT